MVMTSYLFPITLVNDFFLIFVILSFDIFMGPDF